MMNPNRTRLNTNLLNLRKALKSLKNSFRKPPTTQLEIAGVIKNFEFTYELTWKTLKALLEHLGRPTNVPLEAFGAALQAQIISDEATWLAMIEDRNETVHTYDEAFARKVAERIHLMYLPAFEKAFSNINATARPFLK